MSADLAEHRRFLNRYYGQVRHVYDLTRRYYLFGRDRALAELLQGRWDSLVEIGPGTGRNLALLHARRPDARYGGIEASDAMLEHARRRCPFATLAHGFAETADLGLPLGRRPERILFSYSLSMILDRRGALENARRALAPGGEVWVVDFADGAGLWRPFAGLLRGFLRSFHVDPIGADLLAEQGAEVSFGPGRYYLIARLPPW